MSIIFSIALSLHSLVKLSGQTVTSDQTGLHALGTCQYPATVADVAGAFKTAHKARIQEVLETLTALGQARQVGDRFGV